MSLLVVKDGCSQEEAWEQVDQLHQSTGKPTEQFIVLLPLGRRLGLNPFSCCTAGELLNKLSRMAEERDLMPPASNRVNLVLLGLSGSGKSASGNTILGQKIFRSGLTPNDVTTVCRAEEVELGARRVRVVDTPDIFDEDIECSTKARHARSCRELCQGNPTAFLLVMNISRFTDGERGVLRKLQDAFGSRVHEKTVILFTKGNDLKQSNLSFEEFLFTCHPELQKIVTKCGSRCVLFENRDSHSHQVQNLMQIVERMLN
ncbi:uncharacterized protein [Clinocottus analis]|uniref:uncharacterized protein n=1 Tax=Clinocottus analis TaxID=304258 RepID=UPI0035BEF4F6